jgi:hypothetical protein
MKCEVNVEAYDYSHISDNNVNAALIVDDLNGSMRLAGFYCNPTSKTLK